MADFRAGQPGKFYPSYAYSSLPIASRQSLGEFFPALVLLSSEMSYNAQNHSKARVADRRYLQAQRGEWAGGKESCFREY